MKEVDSLGSQLGTVVTVKDRRDATLLHVPEDVLSAREHAVTLLREELCDEVCCVVVACTLVSGKKLYGLFICFVMATKHILMY